jgi:perosamine synthetase
VSESPSIPISALVLGAEEERLVIEVLRSGQLAQGPMVGRLEAEFASLCGVRHAVAVSSGTTALVAALEALRVGPGDEVVTSPLTFVATLNAILEVGAIARFADINASDFTLDPDATVAVAGPRCRVIIPVHLYGQPADMGRLTAVAKQHGAHIVEDAAQAHGATVDGTPVGSFGVGCFSLYATKNITAGEGGVVTTDDDDVAARLRLLRNQGMQERYQYELPGHNWRLTDVQAAIAVPQVARIAEINATRARNAARLTQGLAGVRGLDTPTVARGRTHVFHQYTVRVRPDAMLDRNQLAARLGEAGVGTGVYYPRLVYEYACYDDHPRIVTDPTPVAARACEEVLSLPVHPGVGDDGIDRVVDAVRGALDA